jgi:hypothetical protein
MINVDDDEAILCIVDENWSILPQLSKTERGCTVNCIGVIDCNAAGYHRLLVDIILFIISSRRFRCRLGPCRGSIYMWNWRKRADSPPQDKNPHSIFYLCEKTFLTKSAASVFCVVLVLDAFWHQWR